MFELAVQNPSDDLHIAMRVRLKAGTATDDVVIAHQ
jgi:hypothetical protein